MRRAWIFLAFFLAVFIPAASRAQDANDAAIAAKANDLYNDPLSPAFGNPAADITIVEFYDYQCSYCKASEADLERFVQDDGRVKIVYKDFPKLGPMSLTAAAITLASLLQGSDKYLKLHEMLMSKDAGPLSEDSIYQKAASISLDVDRLKRDMADSAITRQIQDTVALGRSVGVTITPTFIIGGHLYPGYVQYDQLKQRVEAARAALKR